MPRRFWIFATCLLLAGSAARVALYAVNPPLNAYDDHFAPVEDWIELGARPPVDGCWECHQPPLFYWLSMVTARGLLAADVSWTHVYKILQFIPCLAGLLTLPVILAILLRFRLPPLATCLGFGAVCMLPRHIYLSSTFSNDTLVFFFAALAVWLATSLFDRGAPAWRLVVLSLVLAAAIFTKLTALALPFALAVGFGWVIVRADDSTVRRRAVRSSLIVLLLPALLVGAYFVSNKRTHGSFILDIQKLWGIELTQRPGAEALSFVSFAPWRTIETPFLAPGQVHSFWTQVHGRSWFDMEPRLVCFSPEAEAWCDAVYAYLDGVEGARWPGAGPHTRALIDVGRALVALGLIPLLFFAWGGALSLRASWRRGLPAQATWLTLSALLLANIAGIVAYTIEHPFYSSMKATYLLLSLPAYAVFVAHGLAWAESRRVVRSIVAVTLLLLFALAVVHIAQIAQLLAAHAGGFFPDGPVPQPPGSD